MSLTNYIAFFRSIPFLYPYLVFVPTVLFAKLWLIHFYANATPFNDMWSEATLIYLPYLKGTLTWSDLISAWNEHRVFTTKLFYIALFELNGRIWNPILQMQVNAAIHVIALTMLIHFLSKALTYNAKVVLFILATALFSIPISWDNTTNVPVPFLLLFSFVFMYGMATYNCFSHKWWLFVFAGVLSVLSYASGAIALIAGVCILGIKRILMQDKHTVPISAILLLAVLAVISIIIVPTIPQHAPLKAHSIIQFVSAFTNILAWPTNNSLIGILMLHVPLVIFAVKFIREKSFQTDFNLFVFGLILWVYGQFLLLAYGRSGIATRHMDIVAIGIVLNMAVLLIFISNNTSPWCNYVTGYLLLSIASTFGGFYTQAATFKSQLELAANNGKGSEKNVRAYLCTGDFETFSQAPPAYISHPRAQDIRPILDEPTIRSFLPKNINPAYAKCQESLSEPYPNHRAELNPANFTIANAVQCAGNLESVNGVDQTAKQFSANQRLEVSGWFAISIENGLVPEQVLIVLTAKNGKKLFIPTIKTNRPDVGVYFKNSSLNSSGYAVNINVGDIQGEYTLSLGFVEGKQINLCLSPQMLGTFK